jgi:peptide/nickel transport system permease protein
LLAYAVKRLLLAVPVLLGISIVVFLVISLIPGDPATAILGAYATPENVAKLERELGLDEPLPVQYAHWLAGVLQGDLGRSYSLNRPVADEVMERLGPTLILAGAALFLCTIMGLAGGVVAAIRQYGWPDKVITLAVLVGISTPSFFLGMLLILWFAVGLGWFPTGGMYSMFGGGGLFDLLHHLTLPAFALALVATGVVARLAPRGCGSRGSSAATPSSTRSSTSCPSSAFRPASSSAARSTSRASSSGPASAACWSRRSPSATSCWCRAASSSSPRASSSSTS